MSSFHLATPEMKSVIGTNLPQASQRFQAFALFIKFTQQEDAFHRPLFLAIQSLDHHVDMNPNPRYNHDAYKKF